MRTALTCATCGGDGGTDGVRPYGKGGALTCYECAMKDPATTKAEFNKRLDEAGPVVVLTEHGILPLRKAKR